MRRWGQLEACLMGASAGGDLADLEVATATLRSASVSLMRRGELDEVSKAAAENPSRSDWLSVTTRKHIVASILANSNG